MNTKEKAKAYDEALKKLHEIITMDNNPVLPKEIGEFLFPQLTESDDERIRKVLCNVVRDIPYMETELRAHGLTVEKVLTYLEKQKEQKKPNIELIQKSWYMEGYHDRMFAFEPMWIIETGEGGPRYEKNPRYGKPLPKEQKQSSGNSEKLNNLWIEEGTLEMVHGWIARDKYNDPFVGTGLIFHHTRPIRCNGEWSSSTIAMHLSYDMFPALKWEDDPIEVDLLIVKKK